MPLILAIDSDRSQSEQLALLMRRLRVDLIQATSAGEGLRALQDRIPDLILTSPLLSPFDDSVLDEYRCELGAEGAHVQALQIPVLSAAPPQPSERSLFGLGRTQAPVARPDGCDPDVFADEISEYLARAQERKLSETRLAVPPMIETPSPATSGPVAAQSESFDQRIKSTNPFIGTGTINRYEAAPIKRKEPVVARDASDAFENHSPMAVIESMKRPEAPKTIAASARIVAPAPVFVEPQRRIIEPPATRAAAARVEPLAASASRARVERPASGQARVIAGPITFETALAAIRAAWVAQGLASMSANAANADESRVVTREIVKRAAAAESGPRTMTPPAAPASSPKATQVSKATQFEVAEGDAQPAPATTKVRIISVG
ncbi:MAG TPA: hypothetical protein VGF24_34300 [Vicinamibacterales bacterium]